MSDAPRPPEHVLSSIAKKAADVRAAATGLSERIESFERYLSKLPVMEITPTAAYPAPLFLLAFYSVGMERNGRSHGERTATYTTTTRRTRSNGSRSSKPR